MLGSLGWRRVGAVGFSPPRSQQRCAYVVGIDAGVSMGRGRWRRALAVSLGPGRHIVAHLVELTPLRVLLPPIPPRTQ